MATAGAAGASERQARNARQMSLCGDLLTAQQSDRLRAAARQQQGAQRSKGREQPRSGSTRELLAQRVALQSRLAGGGRRREA